MENKINIAELLKDCPKGMELDCTMFDNVTFVRVDYEREQFPIEISISGLRSKYLTKDGCFHDTTLLPEAKSVIFPKGKTTWEGFVPPCQFNDGDIIVDKHCGKIDSARPATEEEKQKLIDKACEWLRRNMYEGTCEQISSKKPYPFMKDFIEEFKQAMKGE